MVVVNIFFTLLPLEQVMGYLKESQAPTPLGTCNIVEDVEPKEGHLLVTKIEEERLDCEPNPI